MFKEVLHHTYKLSLAIDASGSGQDGHPHGVGFVGSGRQAGTGAAQFMNPAARIHVDAGSLWDQPVAVQIDAWVKLVPPATPRRLNIVEADRSFAFFIHPDLSLWGTFLGPPGPGATPTWHGANTIANNVGPSVVPVNQWTKLTYLHDGFGTLRLYIDGQLAALNNIWSSVPTVQPNGIEIGHWVGDDRYTFSGEIDDVRISIYDPQSIVDEFFCRPDAKTAKCWEPVIGALSTLLDNPDTVKQVTSVIDCVGEAQRELIRAIVRAGPGTKDELAKLRERWLKLWCSDADPDRVARLMEEFVRLFERIMGRREWCALLRHMVDCVARLPLDERRSRELFEKFASCDPWYAALIKAGAEHGLHKNCEDDDRWRRYEHGAQGGRRA